MIKKTLLFVIGLTVLVLSNSGCALTPINAPTGIDTNEYSTFILTEGNVHFSFEFPIDYKIIKYDTHGWTFIGLVRSQLEKEWIDSDIRVTIYPSGSWLGSTDAHSALMNLMKFISSIGVYSDFKVRKWDLVDIAGYQGERCRYLYHCPKLFFILEDTDAEPKFKLPTNLHGESVAFSLDGFICEIIMRSIKEVANNDKVIFQHIIDTFKIIE